MRFVLIILLSFITNAITAQVINVTNTAATGRFMGCSAATAPVVTVTFVSGSGSSFSNGSIVCTNPCGSTTIKVNVSNIRWFQGPENQWLHGIFLPANAGYSVSGINLPNGFISYNGGCTGGCPLGILTGPGFYYDATGQNVCCGNVNANDGNPCNNYGMAALDCSPSFGFEFNMTFCNANLNGSSETFTLTGTPDGATGCWNDPNILGTNSVSFTINSVACAPVANIPFTAGPIIKSCAGAVANYHSILSGGCGNGTSVTWWDAPTGGNLLGTGTPFTYDPPGSACPAGVTLYASCCPNGVTTCLTRTPVTINGTCDPPISISSASSTNGNCTVLSSINGVVVVNNSGAATFTLNPGNVSNTSGVFTSLSLGSYTVTVSDASNCTASTIINFTPIVLPTISSSYNPILCAGGLTTLTLIGSGSVAPYQYNINGNSWQVANTFSNLSAGTYTVGVKDAGGCTQTSIVVIVEPINLSVSATHTNILCNGGVSQLVANASGGTGVYQHSLNGGTYGNGNTFPNLLAGTYTVSAMDANGCTASSIHVINQPTQLTAVIVPPIIACQGSTGSLTVNASGGTFPSYQFNLNGGPYQTLNQFTVGAGSYTVQVYDGNNCYITTTVVVTQPSALSLSTSNTSISCFGGSSTLTVNAGGGNPSYQYSLNGGAFVASNVFGGLAAGAYTVTVKDANNCTKTSQILITQPSLPVVSATTSSILCNSGIGTITASASGGTASYQYSLNGGALQSSPVFNNLGAGTYTVMVQDANGCTNTVQVMITQPSALSLSISASPIICYGGTTSVTSNASGGNPAYLYSVNNGPQQSSNVFNNLIAGTYTVLVQDANNCTALSQITITQPPMVTASMLPSYILCYGGTAVITAIGNGGTSPYEYSLNGGTFQTGDIYYGNTAGTYTLTVKDANSCTGMTTVSITQPTVLSLSAVFSSINCNGLQSTITANAAGGTTPVYQYNINGGALQLTNTFPNITVGLYTVMVTDGFNCTATSTLNVTQPAPLTLTLSASSILCFGGQSSITSNAVGGTLPYQYSLNGGSFQSSNTFTNLLSGTYTVQVKDVNGCTFSTSIQINQPSLLSINASHSAINCYGGNSVITVTAAGGTPTYSYSLNGGTYQAGNTFNTLAGNYTLTVKDDNNCTSTTVLSVTQPAVLSLTLSFPVISCNGGSVTLTANATGGISVYQYSLNGGISQSSNTFPNLFTGNYTVVTTDANGCTASSAVVITQPTSLQITNIASTVPTCIPGNDATLTVSANGATPGYQYSLNGGTYQVSNLFNNLGVSVYTITVMDANGCTVSATASITNPNSPVITGGNIVAPSCYGFSNGSCSITASSLSALTYQLQPGNVINGSGVFNNLFSNTYTVNVIDANLCSASSVMVIGQPTPIQFFTATSQSTSCYNGSNGGIQVGANGGAGGMTYSLQPGNLSNTNGQFSSLPGGSYTISAVDAIGCSTTTIVNVQTPAQIVLNSINTTNELCHNSGNGSIVIQCMGGSGGLNYTLNPGGLTNTSGSFINLQANTYTIQVSDANGCSYSTTTTVLNPTPVIFQSIVQTNVLCVGASNGAITAVATGGTGTVYNYNLMPGNFNNTSGVFNNLTVNTYTVSALDQNNCGVTTVVSIISPSPLIFTLDSLKNVTCFGGNDGAIYTTTSGGLAPYSYTLQPLGTNNPVGDFVNLTSSSYTVIVNDANGCTLSLPVTITQPVSMIINMINQQDVTCYGGNDGTFTIQIIGGTPAYSIVQQPIAGNFTSPGTFTSLPANNYTITITDGIGCTVSSVIAIQQSPLLQFDSLIVKAPTCFGDIDGMINAYASGGSGQLNYQLNGMNSTGGLYQNLNAGTYSLTVYDTKGCTIDTIIQLIQPNPLMISVLDISPIDCNEDYNGYIKAQGFGGSPAYTYILRPLIKVNNSGIFTNLNPGVYTLTVKDANGCELDTVITIWPPSKYMEIQIDKKDIGCFGDGREGEATANVLNGTPPYVYTWSTNPVQNTPKADSLRWGYYYLKVIDATGCVRYDTIFIKPGECCDEIFIPNAFTPNGDGLNDVFRVTTAAGIEIIDFIVFNRWGTKVWLTYDITQGWDGSYLGDTQDTNTFYYMLKYRCIQDRSIHLKKGDIMLVR